MTTRHPEAPAHRYKYASRLEPTGAQASKDERLRIHPVAKKIDCRDIAALTPVSSDNIRQ